MNRKQMHRQLAAAWILGVAAWCGAGVTARAQTTTEQAPSHQHPPQAPPAPSGHQHPPSTAEDHSQHLPTMMFSSREASGTSWQPDASPMYGVHRRLGRWEVMLHGSVFVQWLHEAAAIHRGTSQAGSINWGMAMARRRLGAGRFGVRTMLSLEPLTIPGCGYPDLLATGEVCNGDSIHDLQHPHDFLMELAVDYERPLRGGMRGQFYAGLAGEPALGPVAYPHRVSALTNLLAPIGHHWMDATHIAFGVVTAGLASNRWKAEASVFNGREPDENRWDVDLARLDSVAGRLWFAPSPRVALQASAARLREAEAGLGGEPRVDVTRVTASAAYHHPLGPALDRGSYWASTLTWGRNVEHGEVTHAALFETSVTLSDRHTWFGRADVGGKPAHDLHVHEREGVFVVGKLQAGYGRFLRPAGGVSPGVGATVSASLVPAALADRYGSRVNLGIGVFLSLRPASHSAP